MDELYKQQYAVYEDLVQQALRETNPQKKAVLIEKLKTTNLQLSQTMNELLSSLSSTRKETAQVQMYRDQLMDVLRRIQKDYNGLLQNTDQLETLRRIRAYETEKYTTSMHLYLVGLFLLAIAFVLILLFRGGQKADTSMMTAASPPTNPAFM